MIEYVVSGIFHSTGKKQLNANVIYQVYRTHKYSSTSQLKHSLWIPEGLLPPWGGSMFIPLKCWRGNLGLPNLGSLGRVKWMRYLGGWVYWWFCSLNYYFSDHLSCCCGGNDTNTYCMHVHTLRICMPFPPERLYPLVILLILKLASYFVWF